MFAFIRFFILVSLCLGSILSVPAQAGPTDRCTIFVGHPFKRIELKIEFQAPVSECLNGNARGRQTVTGQPIGSPAGTTMTVTSTFVDGRPTGQTTIRSSFGHSFDGTMDEERNSYGKTIYRDTHVEEGHHLQGTLITGIITGTLNTGRNATYFIDGQTVTERQYAASQTSSSNYAYTPPSSGGFSQGNVGFSNPRTGIMQPTTSNAPEPTTRAVTRTPPSNLNCTAYIAYPLEYEGIGLQYRGNCPSGYAEGEQEIIAYASGKKIKVNSTFRSGTTTGQTSIYITGSVSFAGIVRSDGNVEGLVTFPDGHMEMGTFASGRLTDGVRQASNGKRYYRGGREVTERVYEGGTQSAEYVPPASVAAPATQPRQSAPRRRNSDDGEQCTIEPPAELRGMAIITQGECEGDTFSGKATFTLSTGKVQYIVPYRRGRVTGAMTAYFPNDRMTFTGSFNGIVPNVGLMEKSLGNGTFAIAEYSGGRLVSQRTERREPGIGEQIVGSIVRDVVLPQVAAAIDQQVNKAVDDAINGPERRRERRRTQADEARQLEVQQAQERQNIRLAEEENARRNLAQARADRDRQLAQDQEIIARQTQLAADARANAERQAQNQRDYEARQAADRAADDERERQRQVAEQEREAARQRQMAQNTFSVTTQPPVFGGSTSAPVVGTNPPDQGVPPPTVGTNPPRNELPPPVDLTPVIRTPDVPQPLPSGTKLPDLRPTLNEPSPLPPPTTLPDLRPTLGEPLPPPSSGRTLDPPTRNPDPLPSGQDLQPSFPSQPEPVQPPTRNDTLGSGTGGTSAQPTPTYIQPTRTTQQVSSPSVPNAPTGMYPGFSSRNYTYDYGRSFEFGWSAASGATSYRIAVRDIASGLLAFDRTTSGTRVDSPIFSAGREYVWDVAACNSVGCSRSRNTYFRTAGGSTQTPIQTTQNPASFGRDVWEGVDRGTRECGMALVDATGESAQTILALMAEKGGWQRLAQSSATSFRSFIEAGPFEAIRSLIAGLQRKSDAVVTAINQGRPRDACLAAIDLSSSVVDIADQTGTVRNIRNLRRLIEQPRQLAESAARRSASGAARLAKYLDFNLAGTSFRTSGGYDISIPSNFVAEPFRNGKGITYRPRNTTDNNNIIRIGEPDQRNPTGYVRVYNSSGQPLDLRTNKPGSDNDTHIPL
jgi:hypothetical protein